MNLKKTHIPLPTLLVPMGECDQPFSAQIIEGKRTKTENYIKIRYTVSQSEHLRG